jgi:cob(I)alamin adenosyltransferase
MKIYTGGGDRGKTSLFSGERVPKNHPRIDACGDIDELNSALGALTAAVLNRDITVKQELRKIQSHLLQIGAWLSTTPASPARKDIETISVKQIDALEAAIDRLGESLPELKEFILPGGHMSAAWAHMARAICRRVERHMVRILSDAGQARLSDENGNSLVYINRLSDYLFQLARYLNRTFKVSETPWKK